jgi:hypothetical protein
LQPAGPQGVQFWLFTPITILTPLESRHEATPRRNLGGVGAGPYHERAHSHRHRHLGSRERVAGIVLNYRQPSRK